MPRWIVIVIVAPLALCVTCVSLGYFVLLPRVRDAVADQMADTVAASIGSLIETSDLASGKLVIVEDDLDVNNEFALGECGANVTNQGTTIYGVVTRITPAGITLACAWSSEVAYSAKPVVEAGLVKMTEVEASSGTLGFLFSARTVEHGMEQGINRALKTKGLRPTALTLHQGSLTILTEAAV